MLSKGRPSASSTSRPPCSAPSPSSAEPAAVEPGRHVHPLDPALAVAQLVEVEAGRHPCLRRRRAAAGEREAAGERGRCRVARELAEIHAIDPAVAHLVAERVAQRDAADGGDRPAAGEKLGPKLEPARSRAGASRGRARRARRCPARRVEIHAPATRRRVGRAACARQLERDGQRGIASPPGEGARDRAGPGQPQRGSRKAGRSGSSRTAAPGRVARIEPVSSAPCERQVGGPVGPARRRGRADGPRPRRAAIRRAWTRALPFALRQRARDVGVEPRVDAPGRRRRWLRRDGSNRVITPCTL